MLGLAFWTAVLVVGAFGLAPAPTASGSRDVWPPRRRDAGERPRNTSGRPRSSGHISITRAGYLEKALGSRAQAGSVSENTLMQS
jgi:hypothetical protein